LSELDFVAGWPEDVTCERWRGRVGCRHARLNLQYAVRERVRAQLRPGEAFDDPFGWTSGYPYGSARGDLRRPLDPALTRSVYGEEGGFEQT
jgi:hypothetical protein